MAQNKEQIKASKIELSNEDRTNLSDAEFKTLVIRMLTEMVEYGHKIEGKVKAMQKKNIQGTNSDGKEIRTQINDLEKEEINIQSEQNEETKIQKNQERFRNSQEKFKRSNIQIIGVPKGEEEEQEIENFPNLAKEIDFHKVQEAQKIPKKLNPKRNTPRHIIITLPKIKQKERIKRSKR